MIKQRQPEAPIEQPDYTKPRHKGPEPFCWEYIRLVGLPVAAFALTGTFVGVKSLFTHDNSRATTATVKKVETPTPRPLPVVNPPAIECTLGPIEEVDKSHQKQQDARNRLVSRRLLHAGGVYDHSPYSYEVNCNKELRAQALGRGLIVPEIQTSGNISYQHCVLILPIDTPEVVTRSNIADAYCLDEITAI